MNVKIAATCSFNSFNTLPCILSGPHALCEFRLHRSFDTPADDMFICVPSKVKPKQLFSYIKSIRTDNSGVAPLKRDGILVTDTVDEDDILNIILCGMFVCYHLVWYVCMLSSCVVCLYVIILCGMCVCYHLVWYVCMLSSCVVCLYVIILYTR
jgi:hypothetical protein